MVIEDKKVTSTLVGSGYVFKSREEAFKLSEEVPAGPTCQAWIKVAMEHGLHIVAGINEREGQALYNSSVVIGPEGYIGTFRKVHLCYTFAFFDRLLVLNRSS